MKILMKIFVVLAFLATIRQVVAQGPQFFRISGPASTAIIGLQPDGTMIWSNTQPGTNYTVRTCSSLLGSNWVDYVKIHPTNSISTNLLIAFNPPSGMALVPAGVFTIGDTLDGESDAKPTNLTVSAFYMDVNLVSYSQWQLVYAYGTGHGYYFADAGQGKAANHPVQLVDWYDCVKWCNARSQQAGLTPAYYTDALLTQVYTGGELTPYVNWTASGYRLPTEAEWEKAARGGLSGLRFPWGNIISETNANYYGSPANYIYDAGPSGYNPVGNYPTDSVGTSPVGSFAANGYGLYDMAGNVQEWCWDWYGSGSPPYPAGSPYLGGSDPHGSASGSYRITRGTSWINYAYLARCADRYAGLPTGDASVLGFRCVKGL